MILVEEQELIEEVLRVQGFDEEYLAVLKKFENAPVLLRYGHVTEDEYDALEDAYTTELAASVKRIEDEAIRTMVIQSALSSLKKYFLDEPDYKNSWLANISQSQLDAREQFLTKRGKKSRNTNKSEEHEISQLGAEAFLKLLLSCI